MAQVSSRVSVTSKKHIYDGVLSSQSQNKLNSTAFPCFNDDDLAEIFGRSNKFDDDGVCNSIPIMELHVSDDLSSCGSKAIRQRGIDDYCGVFGGDDVDEELDLLDGVELFDQLKKTADNCSDHMPRRNGYTNQCIGSFDSCQSQNGQAPTNGFSSSCDDLNHLRQQTNEIPANETKENAHAFLVHSIPESTFSFHELGPSQKTQTSIIPAIKTNIELGMETYPSEKAKFSRHCSLDLDVMEKMSKNDIDILKASWAKEPSAAATSHAIFQPIDDAISVSAYSLHEVSPLETQTMIQAGIEFPMDNNFEKKEKNARNTSSECIGEEETNEYDSGFQRTSGLSESSSATWSHATLQPTDEIYGATHVDGVYALPGSTYSLHEVSPQKIHCNGTSVVEADTEHIMEINLAKRGKHSRCTSSDPVADEDKNEHAGFRKASGFTESSTSVTSHTTHQPYSSAGPSNIVGNDVVMKFNVKDDVTADESSFAGIQKHNSEDNATSWEESFSSASNSATTSHNTCLANSAVMDDAEAENSFDLGKKQHIRHSRMTSLDLGDHRQAHKREARFQQSSRLRGSYSFDASHDRFTDHIREHSLTSYENSLYRGDGGSPPSLDDQLDINSAAAVSAATLQRALEQAEMRIQLAKEFLERESPGSKKLRFKDTLKTKIMIEEKPEDAFRQEMMHVNWGRVNHLKQAFLHSEKDGVLETAQVEPVLEDHRIFLKKDESIIGGNSVPSKFTEESDKHGGEWEAAKQLNQLISGVKNRIASFMSWQAEKKEDPKEVQPRRQWPYQSEKKEEPEEVEETEKNQSAATCAGEITLDGDKIRLIPATEELEQNVNTSCNIVDQETAGDKVDVVPETVGPTNSNFLFFSFNREKSWNHLHTEEEEEEEMETDQKSWKLGIENRQEELMNEAKNEWTTDMGNEENREGLDDTCVTPDCEESLEEIVDMEEDLHCINAHEKSESSNKEDDPKRLNEDHRDDKSVSSHEEDDNKILKEDHRDDKSVSSHEEDDNKILKEDHRDDRRVSTHEDINSTSLNDESGTDSGVDEEYQIDSSVNKECRDRNGVNVECGGDEINLICEEENRREVNEECEDDRIKLTCEEDEDKMINDDCGDYTSQFTPEVDIDGMLNDEHKESKSILSDEVDCERTVDVGSEDDRSRLSDEKDDERTVDVERGDDGSKFSEEEIRKLSVSHEDKPVNNLHSCVNSMKISENDDEWYECEVVETTEEQPDHTYLEERNQMTAEGYGCQEFKVVQGSNDYVENECGRMNGLEEEEEDKRYERQGYDTDGAEKKGAVEAGCGQTENVVLSKAEESTNPTDGCDPGVEEPVFPDGDSDIVLEISDYSSESEMDIETSQLLDEEGDKQMQMSDPSSHIKMDIENQTFAQMETDGMEEERETTSSLTENNVQPSGVELLDCTNSTDGALPYENFDLHDRKTDLNSVSEDIDFKEMESIPWDILQNQTNHVNQNEYEKTQNVEEAASVGNKALHRRRRWFDFGDQPNILQGNITNLENEQELLDGSRLVEGADITSKKEDIQVNAEANHKRRRWFVKREDEGVPESHNLFAGLKVASDINHNLSDDFVDENESRDTLHVGEAAEVIEETEKQNIDTAPRRKRWFESEVPVEPAHPLRNNVDTGTTLQLGQQHKQSKDKENGKLDNVPILAEKNEVHDKVEVVNEHHRDMDEAKRRKKEKKKERIAVARAIREARERAFSEARERARRDPTERETMKGCQTARSGAENTPYEFSAEEYYTSHKTSTEETIRAERAAVERATIEARQRALKKALSDKAGKHSTEKSSSSDPKCHNSSFQSRCSETLNNDEKFDEADGASGKRQKARSERQNQTFEQTDKSFEEKNKHDVVAQKEQASRNMYTDALDAEFRRWSCGKEGNLRALLSTLHYILGSDSGWQAVSVIDLVESTAVRKAYKKATLFVHPDKLQQRGATVQQKYICAKVFNLLKDGWSKFNPNEC